MSRGILIETGPDVVRRRIIHSMSPPTAEQHHAWRRHGSRYVAGAV